MTIATMSDLRRAPRYGAMCDIDVVAVGDDIYPAVLMDISSGGFRAMVDGAIPVSATVRLRIGTYPTWPATIIRKNGTIIGCVFAEPLPQTLFLAILRRYIPSSWDDPVVYRGDAASPYYGQPDIDRYR